MEDRWRDEKRRSWAEIFKLEYGSSSDSELDLSSHQVRKFNRVSVRFLCTPSLLIQPPDLSLCKIPNIRVYLGTSI